MTAHQVVAGVVTFNPEMERLLDNLLAIADQASVVLVVDNGSANVSDVRATVRKIANAELIENGQNLGIASALNQLAAEAAERHAQWLVTLDQDSVSPPGMVAELNRIAKLTSASVVCPYIVDRNKLSVDAYQRLKLPEYEYFKQAARKGAITSGQLVDLDVWASVGRFDESFFIDYVDYDFNQRVLLAGGAIVRANRTHLLHEVGKARKTWLAVPRKDLDGRWRIERFYAFGHSAQRCYYKARNRVLFTRKYHRHVGFTHEGVWQIPQQILLTMFFERGKWQKLTAFFRGIRDGVRTPIDGC